MTEPDQKDEPGHDDPEELPEITSSGGIQLPKPGAGNN
jgi:hypothetical protein